MIKTRLLLALTIFSLTFFLVGTVQAQDACTTITNANYATCCAQNLDGREFEQACSDYENRNTTQTGPNCAVISGGNYGTCCNTFIDVPTSGRCTTYMNQNIDLICSPSLVIQNANFCCVVNKHQNCPSVQGTAGSGTPPPGELPRGTTSTDSTSGVENTRTAGECREVVGPNGRFRSFLDILLWIRCVISIYIIPLLFSLAFVFFIYGIIKYVIASDSKLKEEGKKFIWWGLLGLFVMVTVWGIVQLASNTLGLENTVPQLQQGVVCGDSSKKYDPISKTCK
jgi:hypothetical protein